MAINCEDFLSADIQKDCSNKPIGGIEVSVVLIPMNYINKTTSTISPTNKLLITDLATNTGTQGYFIDGIKQAQGAMFELVKKEETFDMYKHSFAGVVLNPSVANKLELSKLASGVRYVAVIEKKWKGQNSTEAFEVLGWDSGLVISEMTWNTKESDGIIKFVLSNEDGYEEPEMTRTLLETDYATTKTSFNNKFATA